MELSLIQLQILEVDSFTAAVLVAFSGLHFDLFSADLAQLGIHLIEVAIYELST
jgi:hypothetical protein